MDFIFIDGFRSMWGAGDLVVLLQKNNCSDLYRWYTHLDDEDIVGKWIIAEKKTEFLQTTKQLK